MGSEMVEFPSNLERTVASALLLLSSSSPHPVSIESFGFSASKSSGGESSSSWTAVTEEDEEHSQDSSQLTVAAFVPDEFRDLKLKIVRKKRTKSIWISSSNDKKVKTSKPDPTSAPASSESVSEITTTEASSCLSTSSSVSFGEVNTGDKSRKPTVNGHMGRRASAIMRVLSKGSASEVRIRQLVGDSPSTSKALRMLLKQEEVKRFGAGGRSDPYIYMISS